MSKVIKHREANVVELSTREERRNLKAYANGEITWAQLEGMTFEQAKGIAQVGCELAEAGRLEEARVVFEGLIEGNPFDFAARAALGTVYQKLGRVDEAREAYELTLEGDPENVVALVNRGELRILCGDQEGFADLLRALDADPEGATASGRRAQGLVKAITLAAVEKSQQGNA